MKLRVSRLVVTVVALDEYDAIQEAQPIVFQGDAGGTAGEKLAAWIEEGIESHFAEQPSGGAPPGE